MHPAKVQRQDKEQQIEEEPMAREREAERALARKSRNSAGALQTEKEDESGGNRMRTHSFTASAPNIESSSIQTHFHAYAQTCECAHTDVHVVRLAERSRYSLMTSLWSKPHLVLPRLRDWGISFILNQAEGESEAEHSEQD